MRYYDKYTAKNKVKPDYVQHPTMYNWCWWHTPTIEEGYYSNNLHWHRRIQTTNERRQQIPVDDQIEYNVRVRGRRSLKMIPDSWHDIKVSAGYEEKSWKRNSKRKKQWKYE